MSDFDYVLSRPAWFGKTARAEVTKEELKDAQDHLDGNPEYSKNGWTAESLAIYFKERSNAQSGTILDRRPERPVRTNGKHDPFRWRR